MGSATDGFALVAGKGSLSVVPRATPGAVAARGVAAEVVNTPTEVSRGGGGKAGVDPARPPSVVTYRDVWPGVNEVFTVRSGSVAQDLVLGDRSAPASFTFAVSGSTLEPLAGGGAALSGPMGSHFSLAPPRVVDGRKVDVTAVSGARYSVSEGGHLLTVAVKGSWLRSLPSKSFPITVDPYWAAPSSDVESYSSDGRSFNGIQIGVDSSGAAWRADVLFPQYDAFLNNNPTYRVFYADFSVTPGQLDPTTTAFDLYDQGQYSSSSGPGSFYNIGPSATANPCSNDEAVRPALIDAAQDSPTVDEGPGVIYIPVNAQLDSWIRHGRADCWLGITGSETPGSPLLQYTSSGFLADAYLDALIDVPTPPSRVTDLSATGVLATTTPTLTAAFVPSSAQGSNPEYEYRITTVDNPTLGVVADSGELSGNGGSNPPPSWPVPPGALTDGGSYYAWVLTDWDINLYSYNPALYTDGPGLSPTLPPTDWGVAFKVKLGLGSGGPSPTDSVGSVPGQTSTPSQGAPNPGLPGSKVTVNMVDGNMSFSVSTPSLSTVGGGLTASFAYNSLSVGTNDSVSGLAGHFYNNVGGTAVQVGQRFDPTVEFNLPQGQGLVASQNPAGASATWTGTITFPTSGEFTSGDCVALGDVSTGAMTVTLGGSTNLSDPGPHQAPSAPVWGTPFKDSGQSLPINVSYSNPGSTIVAELFLEQMAPDNSGNCTTTSPANTVPPPSVVPLSAQWLTHSPLVLSPGWTFSPDTAQASWVGLVDYGPVVMVDSADGSGYEFVSTGGGNYLPPLQDPHANLRVDPNGNYILSDGAAGLTYTFGPKGQLVSVTSPDDNLKPAALQYCYSTGGATSSSCAPSGTACPSAQPSISQSSPATLLRTITDPVSGCQTVLVYGGDTISGNSACPAPPAGDTASAVGLLCAIDFWNNTSTALYYNPYSELAQITNPGSVNYLFAYDSNGRMTAEMDPLPYDAIAAGAESNCPPGGNDTACSTTVAYDSAGRASTVTSPAPTPGAARAERAYCYGYGQASVAANGTPTCSGPAADETSVGIAGLSPSVGYAGLDGYDTHGRITLTCSSTAPCSHYTWNSADQPVTATHPDGTETSIVYNTEGEPVTAYGPAPAGDYNAAGQPLPATSVPTATTQYDGAMSGLAAAWYPNTTLSGTPAYQSLAATSQNWAGGGSPTTGTSNPNLIPTSGFSGSLTGLATLPTPGRITFTGDNGTVSVDGHQLQMINAGGGAYQAAVTADGPSNWWRLSDPPQSTTAADSAGNDTGTDSPNGGILSGQPGALADKFVTSTSFETNSRITVADTPSLEFSNTETFTLEAWVNTTSWQSGSIVSKFNSAGQGWGFGLDGAGEPWLELMNSVPNNAISIIGSDYLNDGNWHLLDITYNGSSQASGVQFYVDGNPISSRYALYTTLTSSPANNAPVTIGSPSGTSGYQGNLEDIAVYPNKALSATRIAAHYSAAADPIYNAQTGVVYNTPYPETVDADNPAGYWRLGDPSGSASATDSWGPVNGTYQNVTLGQAGPLLGDPASSAGFNGTTSTVEVASNPDTQIYSCTYSFSVEAWIKTTATGSQVVASDLAGSGADPGWELGLTGGQPYFDLISTWPTAAYSAGATANVADGRWHHLVATYQTRYPLESDGRVWGDVTFYIDGQQVPTGPATYDSLGTNGGASGITYSTAPMYIGSRAGSSDFFTGNISDVAFYHSHLSAEQALSHYQAATFGPYLHAAQADTPTSLWRLGESPSSAGAADQFGSNAGSYQGGVTQGQTGPIGGDTATAATFDGSTGTVDVADSPDLRFANTQALSVEAWVKTTSAAQQEIASKMANASPYQGWELGTNSGEPYLYLIDSWSSNAIAVTANQVINDGNWHHLVVTYDGSSKAAGVTFYIDGKAIPFTTTSDDTLTGTSVSAAPLYLGSRAGSALFFNGSLADVAVYRSQLDAGQVAQHYLASQTPSGPSDDVHTITITDIQTAANEQLDYGSTAAGAAFDPNYGLATQTTDPDGNTTTTSYTNQAQHIGPQYGLVTSVTQDPNGVDLTTTTSYEDPTQGGYLRKTATTLPAGNQTSYSYYADTATPHAAACGVTTTTPQHGLLYQQTNPSPGGNGQPLVKQFVYTATGQQAGTRSGPADTINTASWVCTYYDTSGRIAQQTWPAQNDGSARTVNFNYGTGGDSDDTLTNPLQATVTDPTGTIASTVDLLGRMTFYTDVWGQTTTATYNQVGQTTATQTTPTSGPSLTTTVRYDPSTGRPAITYINGTSEAAVSYDPIGRMAAVTYGNSTTANLNYDPNTGRMTGISYANNSNATIAADALTFTQAGRESSETTTNSQGILTNNYTYDHAGRLTGTTDRARSHTSSYSYTQNPASDNCTNLGGDTSQGENTNRTSVTTPAGTTDYCYNSADQLIGTIANNTTNSGYSYNGLGDQTDDGGTTYTWDASNRATSATTPAGSTTTSTYDPLDRLIQSTATGHNTTRYSYAGYNDSPAAILDTNNTVLQQLIPLPGGVTIALQTSGNIWSYPNLQGDTTATTNQNGTITSGPVTYDPWGTLNPGQTTPANLTGPNTQGAYATTGKLTNPTTGTILLGARTYNPTEARFLSVDPINGGCANAYTYAYGDPLNHGDLTGQKSCQSTNKTVQLAVSVGVGTGGDLISTAGELGKFIIDQAVEEGIEVSSAEVTAGLIGAGIVSTGGVLLVGVGVVGVILTLTGTTICPSLEAPGPPGYMPPGSVIT